MATLFKRLRLYAFTPDRDAREDRLTEALAATLEAAPAAARAVTKVLFEDETVEWERVGEPRIATQRRTDDGGRIDLEISFGKVAQPDFTAWIEAKVRPPAKREQAEGYLRASERETAERGSGVIRVCWLLPVGMAVEGGSPEGVPVRTWQELAVALSDWQLSIPQEERRAYGPSLVAEFVRHLEEEETLAATQPFDPDDAKAINQFPRSTAKLDTILRDAQKYLHAEWGALEAPRPNRHLPDFLEHVPTHGKDAPPWPWRTEHYFEWFVRQDSAREQPKGEWIIGVGVSFPLAAAPSAGSSVVHAAATLMFEYGREGTWVLLCRYMTLEQIAGWGTQHEQARKLARWLVEAFQALESLRSQADASQV